MSDAAIVAEGLGVRFLFDRHRRPVTPALARLRRRGEERWGLRDVGFRAGPGEGIALVGPSGAGKTTLLRAIAGILPADRGVLRVGGRVTTLLSIDAGLLSPLTGAENAELLGVLDGRTVRAARAQAGAVRRATGLGEEFGRPVASWSQGMRARLGLALAEQGAPAILLLDEVHEALDHEFRAVLEEHARALLAAGGIIVAAGHDHPMLERICERGLLLRDGAIAADGSFAAVREAYVG